MEHELKLKEALRIIAAAYPSLASEALEAMRRTGSVLQGQFNALAQQALAGESLSAPERRKVVGLIRMSEPDTFDAMLRCRMSKEQLRDELPARARKAGFTDISKYVRWVLFGTGEPEHKVEPTVPDKAGPSWNEALDAAMKAIEALGGRPRIVSIVHALESLRDSYDLSDLHPDGKKADKVQE